MRCFVAVIIGAFAVAHAALAQSDPGFAGTWRLNTARSEIGALPSPPEQVLKVEQSGVELTISAGAFENAVVAAAVYPLDGKSRQRQTGNSSIRTTAKWEGAALLVNRVASGPRNYSILERWRRSRDGGTLTITRTIVNLNGESESVLVYENAARVTSAAPKVPEPEVIPQTVSGATPTPPTEAGAAGESRVFRPRTFIGPPVAVSETKESLEYVVPAGTRILMRLTNSVDTKRTAVGDRLYLETAVPIFDGRQLIIPSGSTVIGVVTESERAGRVRGRAALNLSFEKLTLTNGVTRDFRSRAATVDTAGNVERDEGRIKGEGTKGRDARTVGTTTAAGAGIGGMAGGAAGAGIGAAVGAAAGLAGVFGSRGKDVILPAGTTMEMVLDRELRFTSVELP